MYDYWKIKPEYLLRPNPNKKWYQFWKPKYVDWDFDVEIENSSLIPPEENKVRRIARVKTFSNAEINTINKPLYKFLMNKGYAFEIKGNRVIVKIFTNKFEEV